MSQIKTAGAALSQRARMNTELIAQTWRALGERQHEFVEAFYERFFERFPDYRKLFPKQLGEGHLQKMVETVALLADLAEDTSDIAPRLRRLGGAHRPLALEPGDFRNFKAVFIEVLRDYAGTAWSPAAAKAWSDAFEEVFYPLMREGMQPAAAGRRA